MSDAIVQLSQPEKVDKIIAEVTQWVRQRPEILAVALIGSWARGTARIDSDIDFMFLTQNPSSFRFDETWMGEINWQVGSGIKGWRDTDYGVVQSRHIYLEDGTEIEFSFGLPSWASTEPIDLGTFNVVNNGCRVLYDPQGLLGKLLQKLPLKHPDSIHTN